MFARAAVQLLLLVIMMVVHIDITQAQSANSGVADAQWKLLDRYPRQYITQRLNTDEKIVIDGHLNDKVWSETPWADGGFVDITDHGSAEKNSIPDWIQSRVKLRWDADFLYIAAELREQLVTGTLTGHNNIAPYHDNDFEVFIDVSGTTEYYKEYEMNLLNSTYDILWGVPDGANLKCAPNHSSNPYLPICVNTSFPGYAGTWTMYPGLKTATFYNQTDFNTYRYPYTTWTLEIAFPIKAGVTDGVQHGGLLSADDYNDYSVYNPDRNPSGSRPMYWWIDFARAEHPRKYTDKSGIYTEYCPLGCTSKLDNMRAFPSNLNITDCTTVSHRYSTLLGTDPTYGCYWEWVYQNLGDQAYMHRPSRWAMLQFADSSPGSTALCRNIEFPGRHIALQIFTAQKAYMQEKKSFTTSVRELTNSAYCSGIGCDLAALQMALASPDIFRMDIAVQRNASKLTRVCTSRPCYLAEITVTPPSALKGGLYTYSMYTVSVNENERTTVRHTSNSHVCL